MPLIYRLDILKGVLDIAVLGLLMTEPMHGYQIRKVLTEMAGTVRGFSYGSLYPVLNRLERKGYITSPDVENHTLTRRKAKKVYTITDEGQEYFSLLLNNVTSGSFTDDDFGIRLAFFNKTSAPARRRLLEGRRRVLEERRDQLNSVIDNARITRTSSKNAPSPYSQGLNRLSLESTEREISWINSLIQEEFGT